VQLVVRDVDVSGPWYCRVLGLEQFVTGRTQAGAYAGLRHPRGHFVVGMQTATAEQLTRLPPTGIDHLSFAVADLATLEQHRAELAAVGIAVGTIFEEVASHNVRVVDPDGLVVEITAPKPPVTRG
jgi:catechol-2,3-dioxygenase